MSPIINLDHNQEVESVSEKAFVVFQPSGCRGFVDLYITLIEASRRLGADIESLCGERRVCGKCKVKIEDGFFAKHNIHSGLCNVSPWQEEEQNFISCDEKKAGYRLGCCAKILGNLVVSVPEESRAGKQIVSKAARHISIDVDAAVKKYYVEMKPPTIKNPVADFECLAKELDDCYGLKSLEIDIFALRELTDAIREGDWKVSVSVWCGREVIRVVPGKKTECYGVAFDIGTTTVAGYLCDLNNGKVLDTVSCMNPQCSYGEDVMSRISYQMIAESGLDRMRNAIIDAVNTLISECVSSLNQAQQKKEKGRKTGERGKSIAAEDIEDLALVGNTAMHHIFLGINPTCLGMAPFPPAIHRCLDVKVRDLGITINRSAYIHCLPNEAGFIGADNVGLLLAEKPQKSKEVQLLIDIGTNGELVLSDGKRLFSTSCATGPALEGAQLKFGMRAATGAIERVQINSTTKEVDYKVVGRDSWRSYSNPEEMLAKGICGSGVLDLMAELFRCNIVNKRGVINDGLSSRRCRKNDRNGQPEFVVAWEKETSIGKDITITQADVRQIQLAKGALYCGCKLMMEQMGVTHIDKVKIAGAFGMHVDPEKALIMGLFPDCDRNKIVSIGNAAGDGARAALLNCAQRKEAEQIARSVQYIELTIAANFQTEFVKAMQFPHMSDQFPSLKGLLGQEV